MQSTYQILLSLGIMLLLGLLTDLLGRRTFLPRVTLLLLLGMLMGKSFLDLIPSAIINQFELITDMALLMIGFLLGGQLSRESLWGSGREIIWISVCAALGTVALVIPALYIIGVPIEIAILLGCMASATAPAATIDTVMESGIKNRFSKILLAIVALDDVWALILFSIGMAVVSGLNGTGSTTTPLMHALWDISMAILLGAVLGIPAAFLTGRLRPGKPILLEALGLVFLCGGLALWLNISYLIAAMVMGAMVTNFARHHEYPFHAIEDIEWPFMVIFFVLAGASLEFNALLTMSTIGIVYILARGGGKLVGANLGARCCEKDKHLRHWIGPALLPQAGVAIGMALVAANAFPEYRQILLTIIISSTIFFELTGPIFTKLALQKTNTAQT